MRIGIRESLLRTELYLEHIRGLERQLLGSPLFHGSFLEVQGRRLTFGERKERVRELHRLQSAVARFLTDRLGLHKKVAEGSAKWLLRVILDSVQRGTDVELMQLFNTLIAYARRVDVEWLNKPELRYILSPSIDLVTARSNILSNVGWMVDHFGLSFFARKYKISILFPEGTYFLKLRGGMHESNFGVELMLGHCRDGSYLDSGIFARVGFDTVGSSLRIVRIGGVKGKGKIINEDFPGAMGINPFKLLLLLLVQFAYQNGFDEFCGLKEKFHPHIRLNNGKVSYVNYYRALGMRKQREIEHFRSIADEEAYRYFDGRVRPKEAAAVSMFTSAWNEMEVVVNPHRMTDDDEIPDLTFLKIETTNRLKGRPAKKGVPHKNN